MITDAVNTGGRQHFIYPAWAARLSAGDTPPTTQARVKKTLIPMSVTQSAGGQELDNATLNWNLAEPLINRVQPADFTKMVDVLIPDTNKTRVHLGDYVGESEVVNDQGESLGASSQLRPYHFGDPLQGETWQNPFEDEKVEVRKNIEFNPHVNGKILGNMSDLERDDGNSRLWIHHSAALTEKAETYCSQVASEWTLTEAIKAICWHCNPDETIISNPTDFSVLDDGPTLEAIELERGQHLPAYLDALLHPFGYNWFVDYGTDAGWSKTQPTIKLYKKGVGTEKKLYYQAPGDILDLPKSNCNAYSVARSIGDMHNAVRVVGDVERREITIPLYPAWPESDDSLTQAELKKSDASSLYAANPTVHRLWVANEAGDITGLRTTNQAAGDPPDLGTVFTDYIAHRRTAEPPLTYQGAAGEQHRRDIIVEYRIGAGSWTIYTGTIAVRPDQIGILFTNDEPPEELIAGGTDTEVRITCTVAGDFRIQGEATRQGYAVNGRNVWLELNKPEKFVDRAVQSTGLFISSLTDDAAGADTRDDTTAITTYAETLRDEAGFAEIDCEFRLPGIHLYYEIGDLITTIEGREVSLDQASSGAPSSVYCQVSKRSFSLSEDGGPVTTLTVDRGTRMMEENGDNANRGGAFFGGQGFAPPKVPKRRRRRSKPDYSVSIPGPFYIPKKG